VSSLKEKANKTIALLRAKNLDICPVTIKGISISSNWWGKAWNRNLESYADLKNRIGRGKSYVRANAVVHLEINKGQVIAMVQGSRNTPYNVTIGIDRLDLVVWKEIVKKCKGKLNQIDKLLAGKFPIEIAEEFTNQENGLFPKPSQIFFKCSCPDSAYMCKHIAATLYGVGARLDTNPELLFELRNVDISELISQVIKSKSEDFIMRASKNGKRVIKDKSILKIFEVDLD